ncbi:mobilization protein MobC [Chitinophaga niastensis]|uniref:Mobilization protein MobC n=1 Tax=Chitinophaga niastensis TaxID=536980 RepID=A0A2P8H9D6_CHINA|nr:plasmid mobilization relaxosome protein MobC [Chitinophaga niastensis]PSL42835.1 mobilization protein MobC [Chitinophaga niastensis]
MPQRKSKTEAELKYHLQTKVDISKYTELQNLLSQSANTDMSTLLRDILHNRVIKTVCHDQSLDILMEELAAIRSEIKSIGVNINQITRLFNTYPDEKRKAFYARIAFDKYLLLDEKISTLLDLISVNAKKWLSE